MGAAVPAASRRHTLGGHQVFHLGDGQPPPWYGAGREGCAARGTSDNVGEDARPVQWSTVPKWQLAQLASLPSLGSGSGGTVERTRRGSQAIASAGGSNGSFNMMTDVPA